MNTNTAIDNIINKYLIESSNFEGTKKLLELIESGNKNLVFSKLSYYASQVDRPLAIFDSMAWLYDRVGEKEKAVFYYKKLYDLFPNKKTLNEIFDVLYFSGRYEEALDIADKYVNLYGNSGKILRTKTLLKLSTPEEALQIIDTALNEIESYNNKYAESPLARRAAEICFDKKQYKQALVYIERSLSSYKPEKKSFELKNKILKKIRLRKLAMGIGISILSIILLLAIIIIYIVLSGPVTDCDSCLNGTTP